MIKRINDLRVGDAFLHKVEDDLDKTLFVVVESENGNKQFFVGLRGPSKNISFARAHFTHFTTEVEVVAFDAHLADGDGAFQHAGSAP